jgi:hypothetical protein
MFLTDWLASVDIDRLRGKCWPEATDSRGLGNATTPLLQYPGGDSVSRLIVRGYGKGCQHRPPSNR